MFLGTADLHFIKTRETAYNLALVTTEFDNAFLKKDILSIADTIFDFLTQDTEINTNQQVKEVQ